MKKSELRQMIREELTGFKPMDVKRESIRHRDHKYTITSDHGNIRVYYENVLIGDGDYDQESDGFFITFPSEHKSGQHGFSEYTDIVNYAIKHNMKLPIR